VRHSYYPTKYQRYHQSQNWKKGGLSGWIPTFGIRTPNTGFNNCYQGYLHQDTLKTRSTCDGYKLS